MNSDYLRHSIVSARGEANIPGAGYTGNADLITDWIDVGECVGPVTVIGVTSEGNAAISGTLSIDHATSAAGAGSATVTDDAHFPGGRAEQGVNATGGKDFAVSTALNGAISYNGPRGYIRGRLRIANSGNATVNVSVSLVTIGTPRVADSNR